MSSFVIDCKAAYHQDQDAIQVISIIADPDGKSLHTALNKARVDLLFNRTVQDSITFGQEAYLIPVTRHESGEGWDVHEDELGDFKVFFLHYPRYEDLEVELTVELLDGRKSRAIRPVGFERTSDDPVDWTNPVLQGRSDPNWKLQPFVDYKRPK